MNELISICIMESDLLQLDGKNIRKCLQEDINDIKRRNNYQKKYNDYIGEIWSNAIKKGKLDVWEEWRDFFYCRACCSNIDEEDDKSIMCMIADVPFCIKCWDSIINELKDKIKDTYDFEIKIKGIDTNVVIEIEKKCPWCKKKMWEFDMGLTDVCMSKYNFHHGKCSNLECRFSFSFLDGERGFIETGKWRLVKVKDLVCVKGCYLRRNDAKNE